MPLQEFDGRVAVVTGAGSGIGRAMVVHFVTRGMAVAAADVDEKALTETAAIAAGADGDVMAMATDVADAAAVADLADAVYDRWGAAHLVCNNAGVFQAGLSWTRSVDDWNWALGVNLYGIIHGINAFVPRMLDGGEPGHVVNTSSVAGFVAAPMSGPYNVSKVAAFSLTECLAHDLATTGGLVGASVLCPSAIRTGIAHTNRLRPAPTDAGVEGDGAEGAGAEGDDASVVRAALFAMTEGGIDPAVVPPIVLEGVRSGDFLIVTKPSYRVQLSTRLEALLERRLPPTPAVD